MNLKKIFFSVLVVICCIALLWMGIQQSATTKKVEQTDFALDSLVTQTGYGTNCKEAFQQVSNLMRQTDERLSSYQLESEISKINQSNGEWVPVCQETFDLLQRALQYCQQSDGVFDITMGTLIDLWGITGENPKVPTQQQIDQAMETVGWENVQLDREGCAIRLAKPGTKIELGGIVKGAVSDQAAEIYNIQNVKSAIFSANSSIYVKGTQLDGKPYQLGIRDPRGTANDLIGSLEITDCFVGTSGDYERYFEQDGVRYHHILDPRTGSPSQTGLMGITVVADTGIEADFLSTWLFIMGKDYVEQHLQDYQVIAIDTQGKVLISDSLKNQFQLSEEAASQYQIEGTK